MAANVCPGVRLLVIVTADYGELGGAMYFLHRLGLTVPPTVLLPSTLSHALADSADLRVHSYAGLKDIQRHLDARPVDAVMLFSGYLLTIGARHSLFNGLRLLRMLRRRRLPVLTSDPFIGLIGKPSDLHFSWALGLHASGCRRRLKSASLALRLYVLMVALRNCCHIYPAPVQRLPVRKRPVRALSYFNEALTADIPACPAGPASWIFVLSDIDLRMHTGADSRPFVAALVARLGEVVALGKHAVLVAPRVLADQVRARFGDREVITLLHDADYHDFMRRLMAAEYAFYWNFYSFSLLHRVAAQLPVMFFDEGHMVRIVPALREAGIRLFYDGWRPPLVRLKEPFRAEDLAARANQAREQFQRIAQGLRQCNSPGAVLRQAMSVDQGEVLNAQA